MKKPILERPLSAAYIASENGKMMPAPVIKTVNIMEELPTCIKPSTTVTEYTSNNNRPHSASTAKEMIGKISNLSVSPAIRVAPLQNAPSTSIQSKSPMLGINANAVTFMTSIPGQATARKVEVYEENLQSDMSVNSTGKILSDLEGQLINVAESQDKLRSELAIYVEQMRSGGIVDIPDDFDSIVNESVKREIERPDRWDEYMNGGVIKIEDNKEDEINLKILKGMEDIKELDAKLVELGEKSIFEKKKKIKQKNELGGKKKLIKSLRVVSKATDLKDGEVDHVMRNAQVVANGTHLLTLEEEARVAMILGRDYVDEYDDDGNLIQEDNGASIYIEQAINNNGYSFDVEANMRLSEINTRIDSLRKFESSEIDQTITVENEENPKANAIKKKRVIKSDVIDLLQKEREEKANERRLHEIECKLAAIQTSSFSNTSDSEVQSTSLRTISSEELEQCRVSALKEINIDNVAPRDQIEMLLLSLGVSRVDF